LRNNNDGTWTLRVEPGSDAFGNNYSFKLVATEVRADGTTALSNILPFNVNIIAPNSPPKIGYIGNKVAVLGETLDFIINTSDRDQDALIYSFTGLLGGVANLTPTPVYGQTRFTWTPTQNDIGKIYPVTITVRDSGNAGKGDVLTDTQTVNIVVRNSNAAPVWSTIAPQTVNENSTLNLQLAATDSDGDKLTYDVSNLPVNAVLNRETGLLTWTPDYSQAGTYNITLVASDGNKSGTRPLTITVNNTNQVPTFTPLGVQYGQESDRVTFKLVADDADGATVEYTAVGTLPQGAILDSRTGDFTWKPNYEQAGEYVLKFQAKDPAGAITTLDVVVSIANVNRVPKLTISDRAVVLGGKLEFKLAASDLDANTTLKYSAINLPDGATLDATTGQFSWQPNPGQVGNYNVTFKVSDGDLTASETALIKVALASVPPTVTLDLTPSFPAVPGQKVIVQTNAAGLATITSLTAKVAGIEVPIDAFGRFSFVPTAPGRVVVEAIAKR
jgi:Putative Ig domain